MYDPSVGRWLQEDPIGFAGGTPNLYEYVENNPTNKTDASGLYGVFMEGTTFDASSVPGWVITDLFHAYQRAGVIYGVRVWPNNIWGNINDAVERIRSVHKDDPKEPIDLFGFSRGAVAALTVAWKIKQYKIRVRFLGLLDPVSEGGFQMLGTYTDSIPNNVDKFFVYQKGTQQDFFYNAARHWYIERKPEECTPYDRHIRWRGIRKGELFVDSVRSHTELASDRVALRFLMLAAKRAGVEWL